MAITVLWLQSEKGYGSFLKLAVMVCCSFAVQEWSVDEYGCSVLAAVKLRMQVVAAVCQAMVECRFAADQRSCSVYCRARQ